MNIQSKDNVKCTVTKIMQTRISQL